MYRFLLYLITSTICGQMLPVKEAKWDEGEFLSLCYHDVPLKVDDDPYAVDVESLVNQIEFLLKHQYNFISFQDVIDAHEGKKPLPSKAILMTFDDGYESFHDNILPILELYQVPAVFAIVTSWLDHPPIAPLGKEKRYPKIISYDKLSKVVRSPLIEIACHTHNLHKAINLNSYKNTAASLITKEYILDQKLYESNKSYRDRIERDLKENIRCIKTILGITPRIIVWPYGKYNETAVSIAKELGLQYHFTLDLGNNSTKKIQHTKRKLIMNNPKASSFVTQMKTKFFMDFRKTFFYSEFNKQALSKRKENLDAFIEKIFLFKPSYVILDYNSDDLQFLSHTCRAINIREVKVIISFEEKDRSNIKHLAQHLNIDGLLFKGFEASKQEIETFKKHQPKAITIGDTVYCDYLIIQSLNETSLDDKRQIKKIYFSRSADELQNLLKLGVKYIASDQELKCLSNRIFPEKEYFYP